MRCAILSTRRKSAILGLPAQAANDSLTPPFDFHEESFPRQDEQVCVNNMMYIDGNNSLDYFKSSS